MSTIQNREVPFSRFFSIIVSCQILNWRIYILCLRLHICAMLDGGVLHGSDNGCSSISLVKVLCIMPWLCRISFCQSGHPFFVYFVMVVYDLFLFEWPILPGLSGFALFHGKMPSTQFLTLCWNFARLCQECSPFHILRVL